MGRKAAPTTPSSSTSSRASTHKPAAAQSSSRMVCSSATKRRRCGESLSSWTSSNVCSASDREIFYTLTEAKVLIERWRREYNTGRPHRALAACGKSTIHGTIVLWRWDDAVGDSTSSSSGSRLPPGLYFRSLLIGYFEGIDSERGIGWRLADSLSLRRFLRIELDETTPDHSTIWRTRRLIDVETHREVFTWVLQLLAKEGLLKGGTIGVDATTLEANAALRSIVRRTTGESYEEFLKGLATESGIATPTREQLARLDKKRKKKGSNQEWQHPHDPDGQTGLN